MGEMATAYKMLGRIDRHYLQHNENTGKWFFVGRVDNRLILAMPDGSNVPEKILMERASAGMPALIDKIYGLNRLTWDSEQDALNAAAALGY
jgi:hypothetical protein